MVRDGIRRSDHLDMMKMDAEQTICNWSHGVVVNIHVLAVTGSQLAHGESVVRCGE